MTEFDFDELDKAVNGLMSNVDTKSRNPALDDPEDKVVELSLPDAVSTKESSLTPTAETPDAPQVSPATVAPTGAIATPTLAVKRRGQFMDMVHPSSDMKAVPQRPSRQGITIASVAPPEMQETAPVGPPEPETPALEPVSIDSGSLAQEPLVEAEGATDDTALLPPEDTPAPLVSPFLPDAKPEKRPLGSPLSLDEPAGEEAETNPALPVEAPVAVSTQPLPAELSGDVLAVESNDLSHHPEAVAPETVAAAPIEQTAVVEEATPPVAETTPSVSEVAPESAANPPTVPAGGSISQQYSESPSTGDQTSGSIYDTANYHQPIDATAAKKKSSPLKWILLIVGLIIVGAACGVAYFLLTQ